MRKRRSGCSAIFQAEQRYQVGNTVAGCCWSIEDKVRERRVQTMKALTLQLRRMSCFLWVVWRHGRALGGTGALMRPSVFFPLTPAWSSLSWFPDMQLLECLWVTIHGTLKSILYQQPISVLADISKSGHWRDTLEVIPYWWGLQHWSCWCLFSFFSDCWKLPHFPQMI